MKYLKRRLTLAYNPVHAIILTGAALFFYLIPVETPAQFTSHATEAPFLSPEPDVMSVNDSDCTPASDPHPDIYDREAWPMHSIDDKPLAGSDGVKRADVNGDGFPDLASGFEEGGKTRIYMNPGEDHVSDPWSYVTLPSPDVEDAVFIDLDGNGILDVVTASEGNTNTIMFHWAPDDRDDYLNSDQWQSVPAAEGRSAWMFAVPVDMDQQNGRDIIIGSKRKSDEEGKDQALVGWLEAPENPRDVSAWKFHPLTKAGWIMSIKITDMNGDSHSDVLITDRKFSTQTGVRWLENPGLGAAGFYSEWQSHMIGMDKGEPMFLEWTDLNGDGLKDIIVPDLTNHLTLFEQSRDPGNRWKEHHIAYPGWAGPRGKAVRIADINLDCNPDIVLSFEESGGVASMPYEEYKENGKYSVIWGAYRDNPFSRDWKFYNASSLKGRKFDLVNLLDLDGDGDVDILTNDENEENDGLGVVWYENPVKK